MGFAAFTFFVIFLLIASGGLLVFYREAMLQRISSVISPRDKRALSRTIQQTSSSFGVMVGQLERVLPKSQAEVSIVQQRLIRAGYRKDSAVKLFYGAKVLVPLAFCLLALATNSALLTAWSNDRGYEDAFARELSALAASGDVAWAIRQNKVLEQKVQQAAEELEEVTELLEQVQGGPR